MRNRGYSGRASVWAALVLLVAAAPLATAEGGTTVNVVFAENLGCSDDDADTAFNEEADLRVTVRFDDQVVLRTGKAQNQEKPYFADHALASAPIGSVQVKITVEEAEPGGFFGLGTSWVPCDVVPGAGEAFTTSWDGTPRTIMTEGDPGGRAAAVMVVLGDDPPPVPVFSVEVGASDATISWSDEGGHVDRIRAWRYGPLEPTSGTDEHALTGLCDNKSYTYYVVRQDDPWLTAHPVTFTTENVAPDPPVIVSLADASGGDANATDMWDVEWRSPTTHDIARFEVHAGSTGTFAPSESTLRWSRATWMDTPWQDAGGVQMEPDDAYILVRAVDTGGLSAVSESVPLATYSSSYGPTSWSCASTHDAAGDGPGSEGPGDATGGDPPGSATGTDSGADGQETSGPNGGGPALDGAGGEGASALKMVWVILGVLAVALVASLVGLAIGRRSRPPHPPAGPLQWEVVPEPAAETGSQGRRRWVCPSCRRPYRVPREPPAGTVCPGCR